MRHFVLCSFLLFSLSLAILAQQAREYQVKAAFMHRFTMYVDFPTPPSPSSPILIGIVGKGNSYGDTKNYFSIQQIKGHPVKVINILELKNLTTCHILFIEDESNFSLKDILATLSKHDKAILTIGDKPDMAGRGLHFSFYLVNNKTKFRVNNTQAKAQGIKVSSFLLEMAEIVEPE